MGSPPVSSVAAFRSSIRGEGFAKSVRAFGLKRNAAFDLLVNINGSAIQAGLHSLCGLADDAF